MLVHFMFGQLSPFGCSCSCAQPHDLQLLLLCTIAEHLPSLLSGTSVVLLASLHNEAARFLSPLRLVD